MQKSIEVKQSDNHIERSIRRYVRSLARIIITSIEIENAKRSRNCQLAMQIKRRVSDENAVIAHTMKRIKTRHSKNESNNRILAFRLSFLLVKLHMASSLIFMR